MKRCWFAGFTALALPGLASAAAGLPALTVTPAAGGGETWSLSLQVLALMTAITFLPAILLMMTSFTRIVIVLGILRQALGAGQTPPNQVLISLALFLTLFIMAPTFEKSYNDGMVPLMNEEISEQEAVRKMAQPFHTFMLAHVRDKDLELFANMVPDLKMETPQDTPYRILVPAFMISELKRAFEIGFLLFVPFLIIDMLIASILMAMGMMMLPPVIIALPFKIIFFVLVDGWYMVAGSLVKSYGM